MVVKVVEQINDDELIETTWKMYEETFRGINAMAVQRHLMFRNEFDEVMRDGRVQKYLSLDDEGNLVGLSTYTNDLDAMPLISPAYFERRWPELYVQRKIWYCGFVAVAPTGRANSSFADLVEAMYLFAAAQGGIIGLDFCSYNDEQRKMGRVVRLMLQRLSGNCDAEMMDAQQFWIYQFPQAA
ncbi:hypothetical protein [Actinoplanes sp. RD1]|uniref:hypothetical protein n=1 Tax=Actinoplanes sp. RD1 TaxID=3064538 RepID=UPI0027418A8E|nr:hypothetical protein [Actinoplanes sp. RD1]